MWKIWYVMKSQVLEPPAELYKKAHEAGLYAARKCKPRVLSVFGDEGAANLADGLAWIEGISAGSALGRWLLERGIGVRPKSGPGVRIWVRLKGAAYDVNCAYAAAFAYTLSRSGVTGVRFATNLDL